MGTQPNEQIGLILPVLKLGLFGPHLDIFDEVTLLLIRHNLRLCIIVELEELRQHQLLHDAVGVFIRDEWGHFVPEVLGVGLVSCQENVG